MNIKTIKRDNLIFSLSNQEEFEKLYENIFGTGEYSFKTKNPSPFILDCGSHIGLSILYFKIHHPMSKIIAFEPNPLTFNLLGENIKQNNINNVELINAAVADQIGEIDFYVSVDEETPWSWGDSAAVNKWMTPKYTKTIKVKSVKLSDYINDEVDLLKIDIEGLELKVLKEIETKLKYIKEIFMEFHGSTTNPENNSDEVFQLLDRSNFKYTISQDGKSVSKTDIKKPDPYWLIIHAVKK